MTTIAFRRAVALCCALAAAACDVRTTAPTLDAAPTLAIVFSENQPFETDVIVASLRLNDSLVTSEPPTPVVWQVSDTSVATIGPNGQLTLRTWGTVIVTARVGARSVSRTLSIQRLAVQAVALSRTVFRLSPGDELPVGVQVEGTGGRMLGNRPVALRTDDTTIATVDATRRLRALRPGVTTLRATSEGVTGEARVEVVPAAPTPTPTPASAR